MEDSSLPKQKFKEAIKEVYNTLEQKGYNANSQIVGYLLSGDIGYIPSYKGSRNKISKLDRAELMEILLNDFLQ